jgi:hypothetical protein
MRLVCNRLPVRNRTCFWLSDVQLWVELPPSGLFQPWAVAADATGGVYVEERHETWVAGRSFSDQDVPPKDYPGTSGSRGR